MMFFLGCHLIDLILQIQGKPERIIPMNKASGKNGIDSEDYGMAVFEYKNGVSFAKTADIEYGGYARRQLVVTGTKKTVVLEPLEMFGKDGLFTDKVECTDPSWGDAGVKTRSAPYDRYADMMLSFGKMVSGDIVNPYTYDYELELYKTVLECCGYMQ